jgi:hypothetical protein
MGNGLDLDFDRGLGQGSNLNEGGNGEIAGEELSPRAPDVLPTTDVSHEYRELDDVCHRAAGGANEGLDLAEDRSGLLILAIALNGARLRTACSHARDIGDPVYNQAIRECSFGRFWDLGAGDAENVRYRSILAVARGRGNE